MTWRRRSLKAGSEYWKDLRTDEPPTEVTSSEDVPIVLQPEDLEGPAEFYLWGYVEPRVAFGLPDRNVTVVPSDDAVTPSMPAEGGGTIYGTLSRYRADDERITDAVDLGDGVEGNFVDNNLIVKVFADDAPTAHAVAVEAIERFLDNLSVSIGRRFRFHLAGIRVSDGTKVQRLQSAGGDVAIHMYALEQLRDRIGDDQVFARIDDDRLRRALDYFTHALLLGEFAQGLDFLSRDYYFTQSSVFLNLWKAVTTIVGDPSSEKDIQSRYKKLGLDYAFFKTKIEWMKEMRDSTDVGHHDLSRKASEKIKASAQEGRDIAKQVISAYREFLAAGNTL